jgi:RecB family exonuclease
MTSPQRVFLDWQRPPLVAAVEWLRRTYGSASPAAIRPAKKAGTAQRQFSFDEPAADASSATWDLSSVIVVVPGKRAGRRLLELLCFEAHDRKLLFTPPAITTEGRLPEMLYAPKYPFAESLTQDLAWSHALRKLSAPQLQAIVPHPPEMGDETAWLQLGNMLRVRHTELAADTLMFENVVQHGRTLESFPDAARWEAMSAAQQLYLSTLDELKLWDIQTARLKAIELRETQTDKQIVLLGTVDLNRTLRTMLDMVAGNVTALVAAPESLAERFDSHGCVLPDHWREVAIPLGDGQIRRVDGPADQADAVAQIMASYAGRYRSDQITVGVPDDQLVPHLQRQLEQCEVPVRWVEGKRLPDTRPYRLLDSVSELLRSGTLRAFASLVRHPDVFQLLTPFREEGETADAESPITLALLDELDRLQVEYLVTRLSPKHWPKEVQRKIKEQHDFTNVAKAIDRIDALLAPLRARPQSLASWSRPILEVLQAIYAEGCEDPHTLAALEKIRKPLQEQTALPGSLDPRLPAEDAIAWTLDQLHSEAIPPPASDEAVELLGWLELPLDDAPALIVTTFNEGFTPESTSGDSFLPNGLRTLLGLLDNDRRYARDAYAVSAILASRESVHFISARRDAEENPLVPSRLLFAAEPAQVVARARRFFQPLKEAARRTPLIGAGLPLPSTSQIYVPRLPDDLELSSVLRVTQFKDYLACPYRFCLRHLLKLEEIDDAVEELAANAFGNLLHNVLEKFGAETSLRDSTKQEDIYEFLLEKLRLAAGLRYGDQDRLAAVDIQLEQMRSRLKKFALWQAEHRADGWRIAYSETTKDPSAEDAEKVAEVSTDDAEVFVDGIPFLLRGRIDRIDQHEDSEQLCIFDYKTGDRADSPEQVHRKRALGGGRQWVDLQLPLYRYLAEKWGYDVDNVRLGYITIPKSIDNIGEQLADWTASDLDEADETMREVVRRIRNREFWPPKQPTWPSFTSICQDRRQGGPLVDEAILEEALP